MSRYEALLLLHVVAAIVWIGAAFTLDLLLLRAERAHDRARQLDLYEQIDWLANRLFIPASLSVLVFGIALVLDGPWTFGQLWIVLGLAGYAASFLVGILYFKPEGERIGALAQRGGPDDPELGRRIDQLNVVSRVEVAILLLVVAVMVVKPTIEDGWVLVVGAALLAAVLAFGAGAVRRLRRAAPASAPVAGTR